MIQEIFPHQYHVEYLPEAVPTPDSGLMVCAGRGVLLKSDVNPETGKAEERIPRFSDFPEPPFETLSAKARYLFSVDNDRYFLLPLAALPGHFLSKGFRFAPMATFREFGSQTEAFIAVTASQFYRFYNTRRFCGRCGTENVHSRTERAMVCPKCGLTEYPKISPAIIVAVTDPERNRILLTRYQRSASDYRRKALVAGFVEVGETPEETVKREVMEETGVRVKNIRPYKMQPWSFTDSLMIGYTAELDGSPEITLQTSELCEAAWYSPEEVPENPSTVSVGNEMVQAFKRGEL